MTDNKDANLRLSGLNTITGVPEVDFNVMMNMSNDDLASFCLINQEAHELCQTRYFWRQKFKKEELSLPSMLLDEPGLNYVNVFTTLQIMEQMLHDLMFHSIIIVSNANKYFNLDDFLYLFNILGVSLEKAENTQEEIVPMVIHDDMVLKQITIFYTQHQFHVRLSIRDEKRRLVYILRLNYHQMKNFLFHTIYYHYLTSSQRIRIM